MLNSENRYNYLIAARNYHFSQFHIWMLFFVTINGGLFVAYSSKHLGEIEKILILVLGYVAAFLFHCSAKGYRYWSTNFTILINNCEENNIRVVNGAKYNYDRVYSCFANKNINNSILSPLHGANISTSKTVSLFAFILTYAWGILLVSYLDRCGKGLFCKMLCCKIEAIGGLHLCASLFVKIVFATIATTIVNIFFLLLVDKYMQSDLNGHHDLNLKNEKITN